MEKEDFIRVLKDNGLEAIEENGVVVVLYDGGMKEFERAFSKTRRLAKVHGYVNSYGARAKKQMNDGGEKHE